MSIEIKPPAALAYQAAESIRSLNHVTLCAGEGWQHPIDAYDVIGELARLAGMLPQALKQTGRMFNDLANSGRVGVDAGGTDVAGMQCDAEEALMGAAGFAQLLADQLQRAHNVLSHATYNHG